jgi:hypothetical protein
LEIIGEYWVILLFFLENPGRILENIGKYLNFFFWRILGVILGNFGNFLENPGYFYVHVLFVNKKSKKQCSSNIIINYFYELFKKNAYNLAK